MVFGVRQTWCECQHSKAPVSCFPSYCTGCSLFVFFAGSSSHSLSREGPPRLYTSLFHPYSLPRWSRALAIISMLWLWFVLWALRNLYVSSPDLFSKPKTYISNSYLPSPLGCLLELSCLKAPKSWPSLTEPALPSLPISAAGNTILLAAQAEVLEVILTFAFPPHPTSNTSANPFSSVFTTNPSLLRPWSKA